MTQSSDTYRRIGRGLHIPSKPSDGTEEPKDLEAQTQAVTEPIEAATQVPVSNGLIRTGRGGAGNVIEPTQEQRDLGDNANNAATSVQQKQPSRRAPSGRGGAGNWGAQIQDEERQQQQQQREKGDELERIAREEVERELKMPEQVHHANRARNRS